MSRSFRSETRRHDRHVRTMLENRAAMRRHQDVEMRFDTEAFKFSLGESIGNSMQAAFDAALRSRR